MAPPGSRVEAISRLPKGKVWMTLAVREATAPPGVRSVTVTVLTVLEASQAVVCEVTDRLPGCCSSQPSEPWLYSKSQVSVRAPTVLEISTRESVPGLGFSMRQTVCGEPLAVYSPPAGAPTWDGA